MGGVEGSGEAYGRCRGVRVGLWEVYSVEGSGQAYGRCIV